MSESPAPDTRDLVRKVYGELASAAGACCGPSCCGSPSPVKIDSTRLGYSQAELQQIPEGAEMGLGCGNPQAIAALKSGEVVLDLGSGGGVDCFLAARQVGTTGRVIGVDMTAEMISRARSNAAKGGYTNVEFRLGEIEHLPLADSSVDVVISNCVVNLSPDKAGVYAEVFRVLKPGGRVAISDVVATAPMPEELRQDLALLSGCVAGAATVGELERTLAKIGFEAVRIQPKEESRQFIRDWAPGRGVEQYVVSATIEAVKPAVR